MKFIFASDFDRTIYFRDGFHKEDMEAIKAFQKEGNLFGLCTGRSLYGIEETMKEDFPFDFYLLATGCYLLDKNKIPFFTCELEEREIKRLIEEYGDIYSYAINTGKDYVMVKDYYGIFYNLSPFPEGQKYYGMSFYCPKTALASEVKDKIEKEHLGLTAHQNGRYIDITVKGISKGSSIQKLREIYPDAFIFGIGDNFNDLPLLEEVDCSFTFESSNEGVKEKADYIVSSLKDAISIAYEIIKKKSLL